MSSEREQLMLTQSELEEIGFKGKWHPGDRLNDPCAYWQIPVTNGFFIYNPNKPPFVWYLKVEIGDAANFIHLNIERLPELILMLQCFQVKFSLTI